MRTWTLCHPTAGTFEIIEAPASQMREIDPEWDPRPEKSTLPESEPHSEPAQQPEPAPHNETAEQQHALAKLANRFERWANRLPSPLSPVKRRFLEYADRIRSNAGNQVAIRLNGRTLARYYRPRSGAISMRTFLQPDESTVYPKPGEFTSMFPARKPKLALTASPFGDVVSAYFLAENGTYEFAAPPNSYAQQRQKMLETAPLKRFFLPILIGLGKVGWAWIVLLVLPIIEAFFYPHWDATKSFLQWFFYPVIWLWQSFWWLVGTLLSPIGWLLSWIWKPISYVLAMLWTPIVKFFRWLSSFLPDLPELPDWLSWLVTHPKLWLPVLAGVSAGIIAIIRNRRAKKRRDNTDSPE